VFPEGFCALFAPAAALPAWLLRPLLPKPVVVPVLPPGLADVPVLPAVAPAVPPVPPPAPPAPLCANAAALENIKTVAKPIVVSFMNYSACLLAMGDKHIRAMRVPSIRARADHHLVHGKPLFMPMRRSYMLETKPANESKRKGPRNA
jgi:hypothetical protein